MGRFRDEDWAEAKRRCRLSAEELRMARELGFNPKKLSRHNPSPSQPWKLPVGQWLRKLHDKRHGGPPSDKPGIPSRGPLPRPAERAPNPQPTWEPTAEFDDDAPWLDPEPTPREIEEEDFYRLRHGEAFRHAADYVTAAFATLPFVHKVVLFGSIARPPKRETPRQRRYREAGARLWHESKDVDLAVWVSEVSNLKALQRARGQAVNDLFDDLEMGVAHHQVDVFLLEPGTDRYLGRLCHFGACPKDDKPECRVEGCGAALFLRQHEGFVFDPRSLDRGLVLFDRARRRVPENPGDDDDVPF